MLHYEFIHLLREFFSAGGVILIIIAAVIFTIWLLALERLLYFRFQSKRDIQLALAVWQSKQRQKNWVNGSVRTKLLSEAQEKFQFTLPVLRALTALCPLFGLMGTVTGMIEVFDVMAFFGNGNARSMASGVSKATIPTMAGMTGALCGVFLQTSVKQYAEQSERVLDEALDYAGSTGVKS